MHNNKKILPTVWPVTCHTDHVGKGSTFVVIKGFMHNGVQFIEQAVAKGARHIVIEQTMHLDVQLEAVLLHNKVIITRVPNTRQALAQLSAQAYNNPAHSLCMIGITGTKGKTTTAHLTFAMLQAAGIKAALISTVGNYIGDICYQPMLTTPQPDYLHMFLAQAVQSGVTHVVMEVAAQALVLNRLDGLLFDAVAWTNFDYEHMEFFGTMDAYFAAKKRICVHLKPGTPLIVNGDDAWLQKLNAPNMQVISLSYGAVSSVVPHIELRIDECVLRAPHLMGMFNVYNMLMARALAHTAGVADDIIQKALLAFTGVAGRMQRYTLPNGAICYIDYAHTPASYAQVLGLLRTLTPHLIVVFGCMGARDRLKRPQMGAIAASIADIVVLTSQDPGNEDVATICQDILSGIDIKFRSHVHIKYDRSAAIQHAYSYARSGSILVVLGKGHDMHQLMGNQLLAYSDRAVVLAL